MAKSEPITIRGVTYDSMREAARKIGVSHVAILKAKRQNRLDTVGLDRK